MVVFNGKKFTVYRLDTIDSIIERLAGNMDTLPKYLYFPEGIPTIDQLNDADNEIEVEDLLQPIRQISSISRLVKELTGKLEQQGLTWPEIYVAYISLNEKSNAVDDDRRGAFLLQVQQDLQTQPDGIGIDVDAVWNNRKAYVSDLKSNISIFVKKSKELVGTLKDFEKIKKGIPYTDIVLETVTLDFDLDLGVSYGSLMEVFNYIVTSSSMPFATIDGFYKILKDFTPEVDWALTSDLAIVIRVLVSLPNKPARYMQGLISNNSTSTDIRGTTIGLSVTIEVDVSKPSIQISEIVENVLLAFPSLKSASTGEVKESTVKGSFNFPKTMINTYVFSDLALNDSLFSQYITIKENDKATKSKKTGLYISFNHPNTGQISGVVTEQVVVENTPQSIRKMSDMFPMGSSYVRVKISKALNMDVSKIFRDIMSRLMVVYINKQKEIVGIYKKFIPAFKVEKPVKEVKTKTSKLQDIESDVFVEYYSRWCNEAKQPTIVSDKEAKAAEAEGLEVMTYPREGSGYVKRNYICKNPKYPWPGVQKNNTKNKVEFPVIPCCFAKPQSNSAKYKKYFAGTAGEEDKEEDKDDRVQQEIYIGNKLVPYGLFGELPTNIDKLLHLVNPDEGYRYLRQGVHRTKSSFLDCILTAFDIDDIVDLKNLDDRLERLASVRKEISTLENASSCRQQLYDVDVNNIKKQIEDPEVYLDPHLYIAAVEAAFKCNIFIFSRRDPNGQMDLPRYSQVFYETRNTGICILIYEHMGSEADQAEYPQCELILKWNIDDREDWTTTLASNDIMVTELSKIRSRLSEGYALDRKISILPAQLFGSVDKIKIIGQGIDSYGKCRMLLVKYKKTNISLLMTPITPLNVPELEWNMVTRVTIDTAIQVSSVIGLRVSAQVVYDGMVKEIRGKLGNLTIIIPVVDSELVKGIPEFNESPEYPTSSESAMVDYTKNKKIARYLTEYMLWLYSQYVGSAELSDESIVSFSKQTIKVDSKFKYDGSISGILTRDTGLMEGDKLVVRSVETQKRLLYVLRLYCKHNSQKVYDYKNKTNIENFYLDLADFDQHMEQVILKGPESVNKWIVDRQSQDIIRNSVIVYVQRKDSTSSDIRGTLVLTNDEDISKLKMDAEDEILTGSPYFFRNLLVGASVYLAQNVMTIEEAMAIAYTWKTKDHNPTASDKVEGVEVPSFDLYSYTSASNIELHRITGDYAEESNIKILGYIVGSIEVYTVLLVL